MTGLPKKEPECCCDWLPPVITFTTGPIDRSNVSLPSSIEIEVNGVADLLFWDAEKDWFEGEWFILPINSYLNPKNGIIVKV